MSLEKNEELKMTMSPEIFETKEYEEQKEALAGFVGKVDPDTAEISCGDGRFAKNIVGRFIKNFGGSLGAASVKYIDDWSSRGPDDKTVSFKESAKQSVLTLKEKFKIGVHRDDHSEASQDSSGCGFADNRVAIISRVAETEDFEGIINSVLPGTINNENLETYDQILETYRQINRVQKFDRNHTGNGEDIIKELEDVGAYTAELVGEHNEYAIIFNFARNTTLDTNALIEAGGSAFCVDVWSAIDQAKHLGVDEEKAKLIYVAEWVATALVLVKDKGKELPPIFIIDDEYLEELKEAS